MITYRGLDGAERTGDVWSPGPLEHTVWVLPYSGASSAEAVVVRVPEGRVPEAVAYVQPLAPRRCDWIDTSHFRRLRSADSFRRAVSQDIAIAAQSSVLYVGRVKSVRSKGATVSAATTPLAVADGQTVTYRGALFVVDVAPSAGSPLAVLSPVDGGKTRKAMLTEGNASIVAVSDVPEAAAPEAAPAPAAAPVVDVAPVAPAAAAPADGEPAYGLMTPLSDKGNSHLASVDGGAFLCGAKTRRKFTMTGIVPASSATCPGCRDAAAAPAVESVPAAPAAVAEPEAPVAAPVAAAPVKAPRKRAVKAAAPAPAVPVVAAPPVAPVAAPAAAVAAPVDPEAPRPVVAGDRIRFTADGFVTSNFTVVMIQEDGAALMLCTDVARKGVTHTARLTFGNSVPASVPVVERPDGAAAARKGALPDGYVTPVALVALINERGLYTGGSTAGLRSQSIYQYIKYAPAGCEFPGVFINERLAVKITDGLAWWAAKNERAAAKRRQPEAPADVVAAAAAA